MVQQISVPARKLLARFYCLWVMIWWLLCFVNHATLTQIGQPVFIYKDTEPTYIALNYFNWLRQMIQCYPLHLVIDLCITVLPVILFIKPCWNVLYFFLFWGIGLYDLIYGAECMHHSHPFYGIIIFSLPFMFIRASMFGFVWEAMRYTTATVYVITFLWKVCYGTVFHSTEAIATVEPNLAGLLAHEGQTFYATFISFFIRHPYILQTCYTVAILIEGSFFIAYFTKKFDVLLIILGIILHYVLHLFVDVNFTVFYIMLLPFVPIRFVERIAGNKPYRLKKIYTT